MPVFVKDFGTYIHKRYWPTQFVCICGVFVWFCIKLILASQKELLLSRFSVFDFWQFDYDVLKFKSLGGSCKLFFFIKFEKVLTITSSNILFLTFWDSHHDVSVLNGVLHIYKGLFLLILFILHSLDWITSINLLSSSLIFFSSLYLLLSLSNTFFICYYIFK